MAGHDPVRRRAPTRNVPPRPGAEAGGVGSHPAAGVGRWRTRQRLLTYSIRSSSSASLRVAEAGHVVRVVGAGEGVAEGLRAAVVEVGVLVVDAPERGGVVAPVGVVGLFEADDVDLAVGELGAAVAGVARRLGRAEDGLAALRGGRERAVGVAVGVAGEVERAQEGDERLDVLARRAAALHALGERLDHGVVEARLPAVPGPGAGPGDAGGASAPSCGSAGARCSGPGGRR